jgi:hypothetical protein
MVAPPSNPAIPGPIADIAGETGSAPDDRAKALPYVQETNVQRTDVQKTNVQKTIQTVVRTPINTASVLFEQAQRLLIQHWPRLEKPPEMIELIVSEFPAPRQLAFAELNRIGETGGLGGLDATRFQGITESERVLTARFGDTSFRHVGRVDPGNILTERRFFWKHGLPWKGS